MGAGDSFNYHLNLLYGPLLPGGGEALMQGWQAWSDGADKSELPACHEGYGPIHIGP